MACGLRNGPVLSEETTTPELTTDEVRHIAALTRLGLSDDEVEMMRGQLSSILRVFESLQQVDTEGVEPTGHTTEVRTVLRDDAPRESLGRDGILKNAPDSEAGYVRVRPILG
ncbi:MAG TPA: Asp-tRNA(Asn)/Glu-tRNA(Gln) amidotransferase GatCAB subunit C [Dehalococcoidia bacterium]|jgi:aspartyl-tRNA(Asn)/glutamyl-tRNA(Gln) amidotransferase subunit C|nr:Asp-tRNA(Asn)/Glu-tRNA(Gln) amidotransferase GatCAB subunit C [Chloroflexota bacterium]HCV28630.1 Asp-tRNA(Asn)/Glu-tRNA(Gln) amidotransferase GatCAB subunit C [Dehalococcoidia bacterium]